MSSFVYWWDHPKFKKSLKVALVVGFSLAIFVGFLPLLIESRFVSGVNQTNQQLSPQSSTTQLTATPSPTPSIAIPELTIERVISTNQTSTPPDFLAYLPQDQVYQVYLGGDVMLGRSVGYQIVRHEDYSYPVKAIADTMKKADLTIVNLENPIVKDCPISPKESFIFCSSPRTLETLEHMGVDGVNLANNHSLNYGVGGLRQTVDYLRSFNISYSGISQVPAIMTVRGKRFGMLGYTTLGGTQDILAETSPSTIKNEVEKLQQQVDYVIVTFHWGSEYVSQPTSYQRKLAYAAVEGGADLVFGHHPHWVQGFEIFKKVPIFYSLGNLVFDQMWSKETREGLVVEINWFENQIAHIGLHPVYMQNIAQPEWTPKGYGNTTLQKVEILSTALQARQSEVLQGQAFPEN